MTPGAILSRILVVMALALFGVPDGQADKSAAQADQAAENQIEQAYGILISQRDLLRVQLSDEDTPDPAALLPAYLAPPAAVSVHAAAVEHAAPNPGAVRILPPVRGPPAV